MATVTEPQALITDQTGLAIADAISGNNTKVSKSDIAPNFSTDTIYNINDYVYYQSVLYRFTAPHAAGAWTGTDVEAVTIGEEIKNGTGKPDFTGTRSTWESMTVAERKTYKQAIFPNEYEDENITAAQVSFDNTSTGMTATNTQNAITELKSGLINLHYRKIAESESTGTYADKLGTISTTYSTLSSEQKKSAKLVKNDADYFNAVNNSGAFSAIYLDNNDLVITCFRVTQEEYIYSVNGNKTDASNVSDGTALSLWVCE